MITCNSVIVIAFIKIFRCSTKADNNISTILVVLTEQVRRLTRMTTNAVEYALA